MKIKQAPEQQPKTKNLIRAIRQSILFQAILLLLAFMLGALAYRGGYLTPLRQILTQGPSNVKLDGPLGDIQKNITDEVRLYEENGLPTLYIDLKFEYYQQMLEKRAEALRIGVLQTTDEDFVPALIQAQDGPKLDAKMRLKGDWTDHLQGDKWSFRIHLKDGGQILGFRQFSIQTPEARNYLNEWAFHKNLMDEGILTTRYGFINALLNGNLLGIYAIEENFTPELIESQGRRQGIIIRFDEDLMWDNIANFWGGGVPADGGAWTITNEDSADITTFQESKIAEDPTLQKEADTARAMLRAYQIGNRSASEVFDVELMGRYFALSDLWSACHGVAWHNWRFYYNPVTGLLEPVAYDNEPFTWCNQRASMSPDFISSSGLFNDPEIRTAYVHELARITQAGYLEEFQSNYMNQATRLESALKFEFTDVEVGVNWSKLRDRRQSLSLELQPAKPVKGSYKAIGVNPGDTVHPSLQVDLTNLMIMPVDIVRIEVNGIPLLLPDNMKRNLDPVIDPKTHAFNPTHFALSLDDKTPWENSQTPEVSVIVRLSGLPNEIRVPLNGATTPEGLTTGPLPESPSLDELLSKFPFLSVSPNHKMLMIEPGIWDVRGDLILPDGIPVQISAGTVLRFERGTILLARGPLNLLGTPGEPVLLTSQNDQGWGGIVVLQAEAESVWKYTKVENTFGIERGGWVLTGGITFFQSPIRLEHTLLGNNQTEDAINVIHSEFAFTDSEFENTFADAIDSDFSEGEIKGCYFHDIQGDAVDVSGTTATVSNTRIERIIDKGVSVGESSNITVENVIIDTVGIGIASKDLSQAYVQNTTINNALFSALAAYIKKPVYGPARIEATNLVVTNTKTDAIAQTGSTILLNGINISTVELDVDKLYQEGILGN